MPVARWFKIVDLLSSPNRDMSRTGKEFLNALPHGQDARRAPHLTAHAHPKALSSVFLFFFFFFSLHFGH